jgi:nuclear pore complex protein Nup133
MVKDMLQGKALSVEDTVDILTMKDNEESLDDFETALLLLAEAKVSFLAQVKGLSAQSFPCLGYS